MQGWWGYIVSLLALFCPLASATACQLPIANQITISASNEILWNGSEIDRLTLIRYLQIIKTMNPVPELDFDYATGANCGIVRNVARTIVLHSGEKRPYFAARNGAPQRGRGCSIPYIKVKERGCWGDTIILYLLAVTK